MLIICIVWYTTFKMQKCPSWRKMSDSSQSWIIRIWPLSPSCVPVLFCPASSCPAIFIIFHRLLHNRICIFMIYLKICTVSNKFCVKLPQLSRLLKIIADNNSWMLCLQLRDQTAVLSPQCPSTRVVHHVRSMFGHKPDKGCALWTIP